MASIFIEGKEDKFLKALFNNIGKESELQNIEFVPTGGYTKLRLNENKLKDNRDTQKKNVIIFDADYVNTNGGFSARFVEIKQWLDEIGVQASIFLFPNNSDDGDFELMLENCINTSHTCLMDCFEDYLDCVSQHNSPNNTRYEIPNRKAKIYSYISSFPRSRNEKERFKNKNEWGFDNPDYWDLNSGYLQPLKSFLNTIF